MSMEFSVIVPAYNRAALIGATLEAIFAQTVKPAEIIVVDDGSTDQTANVAADWEGCKVIRLPNGGAANARHAGVLASSGNWLAFCDSDDVWRPNHLEVLATAFRLAPACDFAFSNFVHIQNDIWKTRTKFDDVPADFWRGFLPVAPSVVATDGPIVENILRFQPIFPSCTAMSRKFYDDVGGYNPTFGRLPSEDLEFTLRCVLRAPIAAVQEATVGIRRHPGNHSGNQMKQLCGEIEILTHSRDHHGVPPTSTPSFDREIRRRTCEAVDAAFVNREWKLVGQLARRLTWPDLSFKRCSQDRDRQVAWIAAESSKPPGICCNCFVLRGPQTVA